ncbi:MAG TPA: response regulator [Kofleriaceae bacterium]|nr:response regulator [Kofleriaceae bacterium]
MTEATILVVDDNPFTRKLVRFALEGTGLQILEAADGRTALELIAARRADVILLDLVLPDIDAFTLVGQLRATPNGARAAILAFSGLLSPTGEALMSTTAFDGVIMKPVEPTELVAIIQTHLGAPALHRWARGRRLVVADDDPSQLKLSRFRLEKMGFVVHTAKDGQMALELAKQVMPDAIVADVLMPQLDGFGLALAVRKDPAVATIPVILITASYVEESDRDLARRSGADHLLLRTPEHRELFHVLEGILGASPVAASAAPGASPELERERSDRVNRQLDRHVTLNMGLARRCSTLASQLTVMAAISEAVLWNRDVEVALDEALAACCDAGRVLLSALYLLDASGRLRARFPGGGPSHGQGELGPFAGREAELRAIIASENAATLPPATGAEPWMHEVLERCGADRAVVVPLVHRGVALGALFMAEGAEEIDHADWRVFAQGIGHQIAQALSLAAAFSAKEAAERVAREQTALLQLILDSIAEGVVVADADGRSLLWNRGARLLLPAGPGDVRPEEWPAHYGIYRSDKITLLPSDELPLAIARRGEMSREVEFFLRSQADAPGRWIMATGRPLAAEGTEARGGVMVLRDISGERYTDRLDAYSRQLEEANHELDSFARSVSHDLRAPLRAIDGFSRILLEDHAASLDEEGMRVIQVIQKNTGRMGKLIDDLLSFAQTTRQEVRFEEVDMEGLVQAAFRELTALEPRREVELCAGSIPVALGDRALLKQVWLNLLANALKYTRNESRPKITVGGTLREGDVVYEVADNGAGFDMQHVGKLFGIFQRLHTDSEFEGTGVGLELVDRIVRRHGGRVWAEGKVGVGALFCFALPTRQDA